MRELLKEKQEITIVPKDFDFTNKGVVTEVSEKGFSMSVKYPTTGITVNHICEFFSPTPNGMLYFISFAKELGEDKIVVANPQKHRFLQRRKFTRISFLEKSKIYFEDNTLDITFMDLSAGGAKFKTQSNINIDKEYDIEIPLADEQILKARIQLIRMEKLGGEYILSGKFTMISNIDKMLLIQYCMNKNLENKNK